VREPRKKDRRRNILVSVLKRPLEIVTSLQCLSCFVNEFYLPPGFRGNHAQKKETSGGLARVAKAAGAKILSTGKKLLGFGRLWGSSEGRK
jgi:hypothetical protein